MQELIWPNTEEPFFERQFNRLKKKYLEQSLFLTGALTDSRTLIESLEEKHYPDWKCDFGPNGVMLSWLHPALDVLEQGGVGFSVDLETGDLIGKLTTEIVDEEFEEVKENAKQKGIEKGFSVIDFPQAKLIAALADEDFLPEKNFSSTFSAEMVHYFDDIPSPVYTAKRKLSFVRMWKIAGDPEAVHQQLMEKPISLSSKSITELYWDARIGSTNNKTFLMSSLIFFPPPETSTTVFYTQIEQEVEDCLHQLAEYIGALWNAELSTEFFWQTELGFRMSKNKVTGNPWIITGNAKKP